ncbi:MAG: hypothetical protein JO262_00110 [Solirubrobacterales bacterium]|nr:hypothetical protein [Solirubrobacterales bacterium]
MDRKTEISDHFMHTGAGTSVALAWVGLIPGVFPFLALTVLVGAVLALPLIALGLAGAIIAAPPYAAWRFIGWGRRRRRRREQVVEPTPVPAPYSGVC